MSEESAPNSFTAVKEPDEITHNYRPLAIRAVLAALSVKSRDTFEDEARSRRDPDLLARLSK